MSASSAVREQPAQTSAHPARRLAAVPESIDLRTTAPEIAPKLRRGLGGILSLAVGILASGLFALLMLNTTLGEGSFRIRAMQNAVSQLSDQQQLLQQQVALAESPLALQQRALALGMVPSSTPVFLRLADGQVLGTPVPAGGTPWLPTSMLAAPGTATKPAVKTPAKVVAKPPVKVVAKPPVKAVVMPPVKPGTKPGTKPVTKPVKPGH